MDVCVLLAAPTLAILARYGYIEAGRLTSARISRILTSNSRKTKGVIKYWSEVVMLMNAMLINKNSLSRKNFKNFDIFIRQLGIAQVHFTPEQQQQQSEMTTKV